MEFLRAFTLFVCLFLLSFQGSASSLQNQESYDLDKLLKISASDSILAYTIDSMATDKESEDLQKSVRYRRLALEFSEGTSIDFRSKLYSKLVFGYIALSNLSQAVNIALDAVEDFENALPKYRAGGYRLALISYFEKKEFEKAIHYGEICVDISREHELQELDLSLALFAEAHIHLGCSQEAIILLKESYIHASQQPCVECANLYLGINQILTSSAYINMGQVDSAKGILQRVSENEKIINNKHIQLMLWQRWAEYYEAIGSYSRAVSCLDSLQVRAIRNAKTTVQLENLGKLSRIHAKMGAFSQAMKYAKRQVEFRDSLAIEEVKSTELILNLYHILTVKSIKEKLQQERDKAELMTIAEKHKKRRLFYLLLLVLLVAGNVYFILRFRYRKLKHRESELALTNAQIKLELERKSANLSNSILRIASLNSFIAKVNKDLEENKDKFKNGQVNIINQLIRRIKSKSDDKVWQEFEIRFEQAHDGFYKGLTQNFPALSPNERRLCAFMKLNMTSKEISNITGQTPHSITVARSRLRKKLGISNKTISLVEFISQY